MEKIITGNVSDHYDAYKIIRFKSYDQGVMWLDGDLALLAAGFEYPVEELRNIIENLERQVDEMADTVRQLYQTELDRVLKEKKFTFAIIGCSFSSEYLSYFNVIRRVLSDYPDIQVIDGAVTAETVPQTVEHIYNRVLRYKPDISSLFMGINDMRRNLDVYSKNNVSPQEFQRDMRYLTKMLRRSGDVILHTLTPCNIAAQEQSSLDRRWTYRIDDWDIYNGIIRRIADEECCVLNDQTAYLRDFNGVVNIPENGLHITREAQEFLAIHFMRTFLNTVETHFLVPTQHLMKR